jgi:hypothetical protein
VCFAQQDKTFKISGRIPGAESAGLYQIQVGAFKDSRNAERSFVRLAGASLHPAYEKYLDFTRVIITGISARDILPTLERIQSLGFSEAYIKEDSGNNTGRRIPVSDAALPAVALNEIGFCTIKVGETRNIADLAGNKNITLWVSSTPSIATVNSNGDIRGLRMGNVFISINEREYISVAVVPGEDFYVVSESQTASLPSNSRTANPTEKITEYKTEPTFRLAYRFNNKGENRGASGTNGGIDILGRGKNYEWLWTTYEQGGWFYDLNGIRRQMINGFQSNNGVELRVLPEFVYDHGVPYLQLRHLLRNTNGFLVTRQKFGASADVMIHENDYASLVHTPYGAYLTDSETYPSLELMFVGESGSGISPVDTLWLGAWDFGGHLNYIYENNRTNVTGHDSAIGFSYQNINLEAGETKEFIVRFTLARNETE